MAKETQQTLIDSSVESGPVECLGMAFENDAARREHFLGLLAEKLKDPEFRKIEGFPIGEDENILALSDPPFYTACPNPWMPEFIVNWSENKDLNNPQIEPFASDVTEGKNHPIYRAHAYHTKVPHSAIMRYILHYTKPGDIILDAFCGTGMTGVAASLCGDRESVESLGFRVDANGNAIGADGEVATVGERKAILADLSPIASCIANNYSKMFSGGINYTALANDMKQLKDELGWVYETKHADTGRTGEINYTVWSDVFLCPTCQNELVFYDVGFEQKAKKVLDEFTCDSCNSNLNKKSVDRAIETKFDPILKKSIAFNKQIPVLINYKVGKERFEKRPDKDDLTLLARVESYASDVSFVSTPMMHMGGEKWGAIWRAGYHKGITHSHHFYTLRNLLLIDFAWRNASSELTRWAITAVLNYVNKKQSFTGGGGGMPGVLYIASLVQEKNVIQVLERKIKSLRKLFNSLPTMASRNVVSTESATALSSIKSESIDYIFVDPPFGANIMYSEGSFLWESLLQVWTNNKKEAIQNSHQGKSIASYRGLMEESFTELFRVLRPGGWMTVEFSNTKATIWNSIQSALSDAGFVVANVSSLDKKQGGFKAVVTPTAVKQDLVISAYKPSGGFEERFRQSDNSVELVWDFIQTHLTYLPVAKRSGAILSYVPERDPRILFDQMIAYYVRRGLPVPLSSQEFQQGIAQRFPERDGMFFLQEQAAEYDKARLKAENLQQPTLFVTGEASCIQWLRQQLRQKPQKFSDINPTFIKQLGGWSKSESQIDLGELLSQNFLVYSGDGPVPEQVHSYLSSNWKELRSLDKMNVRLQKKAKDRWYVPDPTKQADLDQLRERALLKEFEVHKTSKKLKVCRLEALRVGFKLAWQQKDYKTILSVSGKIPTEVLESDDTLLMYYDNALMRTED